MFAFSFVACDDYEEPNPQPQTNPQESVLQTSEVTVASQVSTDAYDLKGMNDAGLNVVLASIDAPTLPEGYSLVPVVEISGNGFERSATVPASIVDVDGKYQVWVNPDDLQGVYYANISKGPKQKAIEARFLLQTSTEAGQVAYVGGPTNYYGPYTLNVIPFPSSLVIEEAYYLVGSSTDNWSVPAAIKFNHSDKDVYDDPVFTLKFDVSAEEAASGWWWKIIPASTYVTGNWASGDYSQFGVEVNGDESASGILVAKMNGVEPEAGCFKQEGQWMMTINMEESTYEISSAVTNLYTPGASNGWSAADSQQLSTTDYETYTGYAHLSGEFKFTSAPDWDHTNYGAGDGEGVLTTDGSAGNLNSLADGLFWLNVNTVALTYTMTPVNTIGVIGDATPGGWDASTALTPSADFLTWTGTVTLKGGEFKFRANDAWDINLGGELQNLTQDGANIPSPGEGTYLITLDLSQLPYAATLVKQ